MAIYFRVFCIMVSSVATYFVGSAAVVRKGNCRHPISNLTPCDFPHIESSSKQCFAEFCNVDYLGSPHICDHNEELSQAKVIVLNDAMKKFNFTSFYDACFNETFRKSRQFSTKPLNVTLAIVFLTSIGLNMSKADCKEAPEHWLQSGNNVRLGEIFAGQIRQVWKHYVTHCSPDVVILAVKNWPNTSKYQNFIYVSVDKNVLKNSVFQGGLHKILGTINSSTKQKYFDPDIRIRRVIQFMEYYQNLTRERLVLSKQKKNEIFGMPVWALVAILGCGLAGLFFAFIGHCLNNMGGMIKRNSQKGITVTRKWQAGFAGGLWDAQ